MTETHNSTGNCASLFLSKLTVDLRNRIYRYLLVNPDLGNPSLLAPPFWKHNDYEFGFTTSILLVCCQIYNEASSSLYSLNTFCVSFEQPLCSSLRYIPARTCAPCYNFHIGRYTNKYLLPPAMLNVRQWKILVGSQYSTAMGYIRPEGFARFCSILAIHPPVSLEVLVLPIIPKGNHISAQQILEPLYALRNIQRCIIRDHPLDQTTNTITVPLLAMYPGLADELVTLVQGNSPVELLARMIRGLVKYAQSFERFEGYKDQIAAMFDIPNVPNPHTQESIIVVGRRTHRGYIMQPVIKLFSEIEMDLELNSARDFKVLRSKAIEYLEPLYLRIVSAAGDLAEFVKKRKYKEGPFGVKKSSILGVGYQKEISLALVYLNVSSPCLQILFAFFEESWPQDFMST